MCGPDITRTFKNCWKRRLDIILANSGFEIVPEPSSSMAWVIHSFNSRAQACTSQGEIGHVLGVPAVMAKPQVARKFQFQASWHLLRLEVVINSCFKQLPCRIQSWT